MEFTEALKILGIEDYKEKIFNSNSKGELFHLSQYYELAKIFKGNSNIFRDLFESAVKSANKTWERPDSVYQHIYEILGLQDIE